MAWFHQQPLLIWMTVALVTQLLYPGVAPSRLILSSLTTAWERRSGWREVRSPPTLRLFTWQSSSSTTERSKRSRPAAPILSASTLDILLRRSLSNISPQVPLVILSLAHLQNFGASSSSLQYLEQSGLRPGQEERRGELYLDTRRAVLTSPGGR